MKIKYTNFRGTVEYHTIEKAIKDKLEPDAYSYEGSLEKLKAYIDLQSEMIANLIDIMYGNEALTRADAIKNLLGSNYEVEE